MSEKRNSGNVYCWVCGKPVDEAYASLEHIIPLSKGGSNRFENLAISHIGCNVRRGSNATVGKTIQSRKP